MLTKELFMKRLLIVFLIVIIPTGKALSQELKKINYQLHIGTTLSIPYKKSNEISPNSGTYIQTDYGVKPGYFSELLVAYNLNSRRAFVSGLHFNHNVLGISDKSSGVVSEGKIITNYLSLPLLFKFKISEKIPVSISTGPYLSTLINAKEIGTSSINADAFNHYGDPMFESYEIDYDFEITKDYTSIDYGVLIQVDYEVKISETFRGVILSRLNYGLNNVLTNEVGNRNSVREWKNYSFQLGLGLKL